MKYAIAFVLLCTLSIVQAQQTEPSYLKISQKLELRGLLHVRYQIFEEESRNDGFDFRRARLDFRGNVAPKVSLRLHAELAGTPRVLDAVFSYSPLDYLSINVGQSKVQFNYDNLYSPWNLLTVSRTQIDNALTFRENDLYGNQNGRDIGLWVSGKVNTGSDENERPFLDYSLGVYNGAGINVSENNKKKDFGSALGVSPVKNLWVFGRYYTGYGRTVADPAVDTERTRFGGNVSYTYNNWLFEAEYTSATDDSDSLSLDRNGYYVTVGYTPVKDKLQLILRLDNYDPNADLDENAVNKFVLGANWYFTKQTRIQAEFNFVQEEGVSIDNNLFALQFQAAF